MYDTGTGGTTYINVQSLRNTFIHSGSGYSSTYLRSHKSLQA